MKQIGRYLIRGELTRGDSGVVYAARDPVTSRDVSIKLLARGRSASPDLQARFLREARAMARVRHPNVVKLLDFGQTPTGEAFLVMEHVEGTTLAAVLLERGPLDVDDAVAATQTLALGVEACHAAGILHRDLQPSNALVSEDGRVLLAGFGLVRSLEPTESEEGLSQEGQLMGTPGFCAPEIARGRSEALGPRADVYGLGALLFALLTGRPPILAETLPELLVRLNHPTPRPSEFGPAGVPAWLDDVVVRALSPIPEDRYSGPGEFAAALEQRSLGDPGLASSTAARRLGWVAAALACLATGAAGSLILTRPAASPEATRSSPPGSPQTAEFTHAMRQGQRALEDRDWAKSLRWFETALEHDPNSATAWSGRGHAQLGLARPGLAIRDLDRALELEPDLVVALGQRGNLRLNRGEPHEALVDLDRALELDPSRPDHWALRGVIKARLRNTDGAREDLQQALSLAPRTVHILVTLSEIELEAGRFDAALIAAGRALIEDRDQRAALQARARARFELGLLEGALEDLQRLLSLDPSDPALVQYHLGLTLYKLDRNEPALGAFERALESGASAPWRKHARRLRAAILARFGGRVPPELADLTRDVRSLLEQREFTAAEAGLDRAIELDPTFALGYLLRAQVRSRLQHAAGALEDLERALALTPEHPVCLLTRASIFLGRGELEPACRDVELALELVPDLDVARLQATIHLASDQYALALVDLERALDREPTDTMARLLKSVVLLKLGQDSGAHQNYVGALEIDAGAPEALLSCFEPSSELSGTVSRALERLRALEEPGPGSE